jgi:methyl-accepting chemotaxis protein
VVAGEVKQLASQTASAIEDIQQRVLTIQGDTTSSTGSISEVGQIILEIADKQARIAASVEQQSMIAKGIRENLQLASVASTEIAGSLQGVSEAAADTSRGTSQTLAAAQELTRTATDLQRLVQHFRC